MVLRYPSSLTMLEFILSNPKEAAKACKDPNFTEMLRVQQFFTWQVGGGQTAK